MRSTVYVASSIAIFFGMVFFLEETGLQGAAALLFGWFAFTARVLPQVTIRWDGVAMFLGAMSLFTVLFHNLVAWLAREMFPGRLWRVRSTAIAVLLVVAAFVAGTAMIGATHQIAWLMRDGPLREPALRGYNRPSIGEENLRQIHWGLDGHNSVYRRLPMDGVTSRGELPEHSWVTCSLSMMWFGSDIQRHKTWDHEDNRQEACKLVPVLLNPALRPLVLRTKEGFGVSHYAGNTHVFDHPCRLDDIDPSGRILVGEINDGFQPWAKPRTCRDPLLGLHGGCDAFGGAAEDSVVFLFSDGSVRSLSTDIDSSVLCELSVP